MSNEFLDRALRLVEQGYTVVPIRSGSKRPTGAEVDGWTERFYDEKALRRLAERGYKDGNIGINTKDAPAVDLDIYDADVAQEMEEWVIENYGDAPVRVGQAPKRLLAFRTDEPFRKLSSTWRDTAGKDHKIEILGAGQQYVAFGTHPDTKKPYTWTSLDTPLDTAWADLPELTHLQAVEIIEHFEEVCERLGWTRRSGSHGGAIGTGDDLDTMKPALSITEDTIIDALSYIDNDDADYDEYMLVGFALHHQYGGDARGLELWHEWAGKSSKYDPSDVNRRYRSMGHGPDTATFATILYRANDIKARLEDQAFETALNRIDPCNDKRELRTKIAKDLMQSAATDLQYDEAVRRLQRRLGELSEGVKPRLESVKKEIEKFRPKPERREGIPKWCENWYYIKRSNSFYNTNSGEMVNKAGFDAEFGRKLISDDQRARGEAFAGRASDAALNLYEIPTVYDAMYMPGYETTAVINGLSYVNLYNHLMTPLESEPKTRDARQAIKMAEKHFELLFPDDRERNILLDYLAYTVQFPKEKITWGVLIQGVDGSGKSWLAGMMAAVLGGLNVRVVDATALKEQFTKWMQGYRMVFFSEIRLRGESRFEILDKLKRPVSDPSVDVRMMQRDSFEVPNFTNYVMFTNFPDALPINNNDRRYFILKTSFQTKEDIDTFEAQHPTYFADLFNILSFDAPALRWWLMEREISIDFPAKGKAPSTDAKAEMREDAEGSDDMETLEALIADPDYPEITNEVLLGRALSEGTHELVGLNKRTMASLLHRAGFAKIGQYWLEGRSEKKVTVYTRKGSLYRGKSHLEVVKELLGPLPKGDGF